MTPSHFSNFSLAFARFVNNRGFAEFFCMACEYNPSAPS